MNIIYFITIFVFLSASQGISGRIEASSNKKNACIANTRDSAKPHDRPIQSHNCTPWYIEYNKCGQNGLLKNHQYPQLRWLCKITDQTVYGNNQVAINVNLIKSSDGDILQDDMGECQFVNPCKAH